jgi:hypothetical protein
VRAVRPEDARVSGGSHIAPRRVDAWDMETPQESEAGYPEEQPAEVTPDRQEGTPQRDRAMPDEGGEHGEGGSAATRSGEGGAGTATGNPNN